MADGQELTVVPEASDWSRQARELGPLFAAVFSGSTTAVKAEPAK